jgi:glycine/serine hydroxymethyltransferase
VAGYIADILQEQENEARQQEIAGEVRAMMTRFPLPGVEQAG